MNLVISTDSARVTQQQIAVIYASVGFGTEDDYIHRPHFMAQHFGAGVFAAFAFIDDEPVGLLRAFSDGWMVAWIAELCVMPSHQRKGIGSALMRVADDRFADMALYAEAFTDNAEFFNKRGLRSRSILVPCTRGPLKRPLAA